MGKEAESGKSHLAVHTWCLYSFRFLRGSSQHCRFKSILGLCSPGFWCGLETISADTFSSPRVVSALCSVFSYILPVLLLRLQNAKVHILDTESFESTFGPKSQRKRPNLFASDMQSLLENAEMSTESYDQGKDRDLVTEDTGVRYALDPCCCASYRMSSLGPSCCCGAWQWRSQVVSSDQRRQYSGGQTKNNSTWLHHRILLFTPKEKGVMFSSSVSQWCTLPFESYRMQLSWRLTLASWVSRPLRLYG